MDRRLFAALATAGALAVTPVMAHQARQSEIAPSQLNAQQVTQIQQQLDQQGFKAGRPDGKWGHETAQAVKQFQQKNNLPVTGKLDQQTLAQLGVNLNGNEPMQAQSRSRLSPERMTGSSQPPQQMSQQSSTTAGDSQMTPPNAASGSSQMSKEQAEQTLKNRGYQQVQLSDQNGKLQGTAMKGGKQYEVAVSQSGQITERPMQ